MTEDEVKAALSAVPSQDPVKVKVQFNSFSRRLVSHAAP